MQVGMNATFVRVECIAEQFEILINMERASKFGIFVLVLMVSFWNCHGLRCQLEDGPSEEELKRVARVCMRKLGDNSDRKNNTEDSYEDSNSDESYDNNKRRNTNNNAKTKSNNDRGNRFVRDMDLWQQPQNGYDNPNYGNRNQERYDNNRYGNSNDNNGFNYGGGYGNGGFSNNENGLNYNMTNRSRNDNENDGYDKSCMIQCFFQEMKMTNNDGFPDRHKVERVVSQDVRDREMRNFLMDSIQECFHIVEMERRRDKCIFSKNIVSCLSERAKANCDDYYNETMIF